MDTTLEQPVRAWLVTAEDQALPVPATLRYDGADPFAVHVDFPSEVSLAGEPVTWTFGRGLLEEGVDGPAGSGDVHIWPCGRVRTVLEFHSPLGMALLQFDTGALRRFLLRSYAVVARGGEDVDGALDRGLQALLGNV
ncbi:SsgA family sporulation/cell division regulator [Streptomyces sp. NBC_00199]|uniref:SsgA family sporulation/cell division regulator n=1 Tax=Streptomyces sp. NBC_00199 TaxID=2975678 RepID=UPI0022595A23|nr:SsgA family sporulation/cell division regulator [Streptomyces sp. NBC_00199]MCX5263973.1 SsgA family sporulation/cell division regulator [Streptomyces sp. NBC_00199]